MPSPSKQKGSGFEREVAKLLTEQYGQPFVRAPGSGAYTGGSNKVRRQTLHGGQVRSFKGDIMPPEEFGLLNVEAKFYADFPFHQLFTYCQQLEDWLEQLLDAGDPGDIHALFMKFNRKGKYVAVPSSLPLARYCNCFSYTSTSHGSWTIYSLETFLKLNGTQFKELCNPNTSTVAPA